MERNNLIKKGVVVAVILLFVSVSVIPSTGNIVEDAQIDCFSIPYYWANQPPEALNITGPHYGRPCMNYTFCIEGVGVDPDGDDLLCMWDWGDGNFSDWLGPYGSGEIMCASHAWSEEGTYTIRVKLKDIYGNEIDWLSHVIIIEAGVPYVEITKPKRAVYIRDKKIIPFIVPVIIRDIQFGFGLKIANLD